MADTKRLLSIEEILEAHDIEEMEVEVPQWGGTVRVRGFSKAEQQALRNEATIAGKVDNERLEMLMFIHGVAEPRFGVDQYELLREKSAGAIDRVLTKILEINGLTPEALKAQEKSF